MTLFSLLFHGLETRHFQQWENEHYQQRSSGNNDPFRNSQQFRDDVSWYEMIVPR